MSKSEIFDRYAEIALEKGLIKEADEKTKESKEMKKYKSDSYPRAGSDDLSTIEALYGVKNEGGSADYDRCITEVAHPHSVVISPSYDKLNGLVENDIERANIMHNIVLKQNNGNSTQHKYANKELLMELIRVANHMDAYNKEEIRVLADTCIDQLNKQAFDWSSVGLGDVFKERGGDIADIGGGAASGAAIGGTIGALVGIFGGPAVIPAIGVGAGAGAIIGGVMAAISKTSPQAKNVAVNAELASKQLNDLIKVMPGDKFLLDLNTALIHIIETANTYAGLVDKMHTEHTDTANQAAKKIGIDYLTEIGELDKKIDIFLSNAKLGKYAPQESDMWAKVKSPFTAMFGDDVHDAVVAMEALERVTHTAIDGINAVQKEVASVKDELTQPSSKDQSTQPSSKDQSTQTGAPATLKEEEINDEEPSSDSVGTLGIKPSDWGVNDLMDYFRKKNLD